MSVTAAKLYLAKTRNSLAHFREKKMGLFFRHFFVVYYSIPLGSAGL